MMAENTHRERLPIFWLFLPVLIAVHIIVYIRLVLETSATVQHLPAAVSKRPFDNGVSLVALFACGQHSFPCSYGAQ